MNRHLVFAVLLLLGRVMAFANEPAPASHEPAAAHPAPATHGEPKPAHEGPPTAETNAPDADQAHAATTEQEPVEPAAATEHTAPAPEHPAATEHTDATEHTLDAEAPTTSGHATAAGHDQTPETEEAKPHEPVPDHAKTQENAHTGEPAAHQTETGDHGHAAAEKTDTHAKPADTHAKPAEGHAAAAETHGATKDAHATKTEGHGATEGHAATAEHGAKAEGHAAAAQEHNDPTEASIPELLNYASKAYEKGRYEMALVAYGKLLNMRMPRDQKKVVLIGYARTLRKKGDLTKAVAVYERLVKDFQLDAEAPDIYLELGRAQRALGAYKTAITRFYNVLNSTIKLPEDGAARYRQLAKTAQFEIAETYFMEGNYTEASRFYARLRLLDLAQVDRAKAHFKAAFSLQLAGDNKGAIALYRSFLEQNPDDDNVPEAHYQLATCLTALGRPQEAFMETLDLLRAEKAKTAKDPKVWAYWQRRTGNQIANEFYERGNFRNALNIYDTLQSLSQDPAWSLPIAYQIALCYERLGITDKAIGNYKSIITSSAAVKADDPRREDYADLSRMSEWRLKQIDWVHNTERKLDTMLPAEPEPELPPAPGSTQKK